LKPFCHRKDIAIKQAYWTKMLVDKAIKRQLSKEGFVKRDYVVSYLERIFPKKNSKLFCLVSRN
jgi:mannitol/fructose-specific phosphotransferase system IIA component